ncbi:MAG: UDP-N-acetylmuramate dehydrogenase [Phycisphaeraceae bacterium]|nr:UDP-N-acetylmuramate dehydrogenase [Phycisphaeraceae bacterium]
MTTAQASTPIEHNAFLPTWFGVGGTADALARPDTIEAVAQLVREHHPVRVLGDGANLLVDDDGVDGLVLCLKRLNTIEYPDDTTVRAGAGVKLPALITETIRNGLGGLERLGGIPATVGGAVAMNAGGAWGEIADLVNTVQIVDPDGAVRDLDRAEIEFGYRSSGLTRCVVVRVDFALTPGDPETLRESLKRIMEYKKNSQPLAERSAGCAFKNPVVAGERVSAGALIDQAGCKGLRHHAAHVSEKHANFICIDPGGCAHDAIGLMEMVEQRVRDAHGVTLEREVVIWRRSR